MVSLRFVEHLKLDDDVDIARSCVCRNFGRLPLDKIARRQTTHQDDGVTPWPQPSKKRDQDPFAVLSDLITVSLGGRRFRHLRLLKLLF